MSKIKIQIKSVAGSVLFEYEKDNNTIMDTLIEAVKSNADLRGAYLRGAYLRGAYLGDAYLDGADLRGADLGGAYLDGADLRGADLGGADLRGANLRCADLRGAYLRGAYLRDADLRGADLGGAYLRDADLGGADLGGADLGDAYLRGADLGGADLGDAYLDGADLRGADLGGANNIPYIPLACPSDGSFVGWKKVGDKLVKLQIPEDARRSSATTNKCRCDKALVLAITDLDGSNPIDRVINYGYYHETIYKVGEKVYSDSFDEDRYNECSNGIHFFINKQDAINYKN